jgi:hypothetical protein
MIKLLNKTIDQHFTSVDTGFTDPISGRKNFGCTFIDNNASTLVVTVGDSWTWGADMTVNDDETFRLTNHYGRILSSELDSDWLNLGQGGSGNFWLGGKVKELSTIIPQLDYQHIYIICTFTEPGRAFDSLLDRHLDYISWFNNNSNYNDLLKFLNNYITEQILDVLTDYKNITLKIGSNFIDHIGLEKFGPALMPNTWLETIYNKKFNTCYMVSTPVIESLKRSIDLCNNKNKYLDWIIELSDAALVRRNILEDSNNFRNYHPLAHGHRVWGKYILENI